MHRSRLVHYDTPAALRADGMVGRAAKGWWAGVPDQIRRADALLRQLLAIEPVPVTVARAPRCRVVGTCRHFAVLSCALLRHRGIASRVRCGFATYFEPGLGLDHWVTEFRDHDEARWVRIDSEVLALTLVPDPSDLAPDEFLTGGEAWTALRRGEIDDSRFGVAGTQNWGAAEISGNAVKDLAALNKVESLPWDEWGRMTEAYQGRTGPDYDDLIDVVAAACADDDLATVASLYQRTELQVPAGLIA